MKKSITKTMLLVMIAALSVMMVAQIAKAAISTTKHNLSTSGTGTVKAAAGQTDQICVFCHTPHFALTGGAPLWNLTLTTQSFTTYGNTMAGTAWTTPSGISKACLSCHDGATAVNSLANMPGATKAGTVTMVVNTVDGDNSLLVGSTANLGLNMADDHPVSIIYTTGTASVRAPTGTNTSVAKVLTASTVSGTSGTSKVECASCHNPHDNANTPFLRLSNAASGLCLACHVK